MRELLEKLSIPLAVFVMGIIGVPLGAQIRGQGGRSAGIGISLVVFALYYLFLMIIRSISSTGALPPAFAVWIPDLFLIVSVVYLLRRASHERSIHLLPGLPFFRRKSGN